MCEKNKFSELEKWFFRKASVFTAFLGKQCSRSPRLPTYRFLCGLVKHVRKKSEVKKLCFRKASVFFNLLGKTMFQVPKPTQILILRGLEAIQACAKKDNCSELEKMFHQQSPISSHKTIRGHAAQKKTQRGIANLTCKQ